MTLIIFFYLNFYIFIIKYFYKRRYSIYLFIAFVSFVIVAVIPFWLIPTETYSPHSHSSHSLEYNISPFKLFLFETRHTLILFFAIFLLFRCFVMYGLVLVYCWKCIFWNYLFLFWINWFLGKFSFL